MRTISRRKLLAGTAGVVLFTVVGERPPPRPRVRRTVYAEYMVAASDLKRGDTHYLPNRKPEETPVWVVTSSRKDGDLTVISVVLYRTGVPHEWRSKPSQKYRVYR